MLPLSARLRSQCFELPNRRIHPFRGESKFWWHVSGLPLGVTIWSSAIAHCVALVRRKLTQPTNQPFRNACVFNMLVGWLSGLHIGNRTTRIIGNDQGVIPKCAPKKSHHNFNPPGRRWVPHFGSLTTSAWSQALDGRTDCRGQHAVTPSASFKNSRKASSTQVLTKVNTTSLSNQITVY